MAKTQLSIVKKQSPEQLRAELIDRYADLNAQASQIDKTRREIRKQVLSLMPAIPEGQKSVEVTTETAVATLVIGESTEVMPQALFTQHPDLFWGLAKVGVTALKPLLSGEDFRAVTRIVLAQAPELTVRKKKDVE